MEFSSVLRNNVFSEQLRSFIQDTGTPLNFISKVLNQPPELFLKWWSGSSDLLITENHILGVAKYFNIERLAFVERQYDALVFKNLFLSEKKELSARYSVNQKSCIRTSAHIIQYLIKTRGRSFSDDILFTLGVHPSFYENLDNKINLIYFIDLLELLSLKGLTDQELDHLACVLFLTLGQTEFGQKMHKAQNYYSCYKVLKENIHLFDSNFDYEFEFTTFSVKITSKLDFTKHQALNWKKVNFSRLFRYRQILSGSIPFLAQLAPVMPEVTITQQDQSITCQYHIKFN